VNYRKLRPLVAVGMILFVLMFITGCGDGIKDDLLSYSQNTKPLEKFENESIKTFSAIVNKTSNDEEAIKSLQEGVIPNLQKIQGGLEVLQPKTTEVQKLKDTHISIVKAQTEAVNLLIDGLKQKKDEIVDQAVTKFTKVGSDLDAYNKDFEKLAKDHGLEVEK